MNTPPLNQLIDALSNEYRAKLAPIIAQQAYTSARMLISPNHLSPEMVMTPPRTQYHLLNGQMPFVVILTGQQLLCDKCFLLYFELREGQYDPNREDPFILRLFTCSPKHDACDQQLVILDPVLVLEVQRQLKTYFHEPLEHSANPASICGLRYLSIIDLDPASLPAVQE